MHEPLTEAELERVRRSAVRGSPLGNRGSIEQNGFSAPPRKHPRPRDRPKEALKVPDTFARSTTYTTSTGISVTYDKEGYPDFRSAGLVKVEVYINMAVNDDTRDFKCADRQLMRLHKKTRNTELETWHHHQNLVAMQLVDRKLHRKFYHWGGSPVSKATG